MCYELYYRLFAHQTLKYLQSAAFCVKTVQFYKRYRYSSTVILFLVRVQVHHVENSTVTVPYGTVLPIVLEYRYRY